MNYTEAYYPRPRSNTKIQGRGSRNCSLPAFDNVVFVAWAILDEKDELTGSATFVPTEQNDKRYTYIPSRGSYEGSTSSTNVYKFSVLTFFCKLQSNYRQWHFHTNIFLVTDR